MDEKMMQIAEKIKAEMIGQARMAAAANRTVPVSGQRYDLPLEGRTLDMVFYPAPTPNAPLLLGFHGGGFLFGGSALDDAMWCAVRDALGVNIASIGYRLTPDYKYPAPIEDAYDSAVYLKNHASEYHFDPEHISVGGCSAGGNISAAVCYMAKEKGGISFDHQILIYPELDNASDPVAKGNGTLPLALVCAFGDLYVVRGREKEIFCSPILAGKDQMQGLPHAVIVTAEHDNLKAEAQKYAENLQAAGVKADYIQISNMPHGFFEYGFGTAMGQDFLDEPIRKQIQDGSISKGAKEALEFICSHI